MSPATSSELLGFPADARVLIVNCDDLGMSADINTAVIDSIERGIGASCSLMVPCPAARPAMDLLRERPEIPFGVHLTMVRDTDRNRWGPVAPRDQVSSLLNTDGELFLPTAAGREALMSRARLDEVEREFRAQITAVLAAGLAPAHLDFHCLADGGRDDILDLTLGLAAEFGLAVRVWLEPARRRLRQRGLPVVDHGFLDSFSLDLETKAARYVQLLRELPTGLSEWAVHPSIADHASRSIDDGWRVRRTDYEFLISPIARDIIAQQGIEVINYRPLQRAWEMDPRRGGGGLAR